VNQEAQVAMPYFTCFVSYGGPDAEFARKLVKDLQSAGVQCWFYDQDATPGERTQTEIVEQRRKAERMIVLCSIRSLLQDGVLSEIDDQIREDPDKLIPVSLDDVWRHSGFRIIWGGHDLKPFLMERNYLDFSDSSLYDASLSQLLAPLRHESSPSGAAPSATDRNHPDLAALERRVASVASLLKLRSDAKDLEFVPQILNQMASVLILKYDLLPTKTLKESKIYLKLINLLKSANDSALSELDAALSLKGMSISEFLRRFHDILSVMAQRTRSRENIETVQAELAILYTMIEALVAEQADQAAAKAKVDIIASIPDLGESDYTEYKESLRYNVHTKKIDGDLEFEAIRAIAGLANHQGGTLYIGVNDLGEIVGIDKDLHTFRGNRKDRFRVHFDQLVSDRLGVENYQVVEAGWAEPDGKLVFVVVVRKSDKPVFADGEFYVRRGARTVKLGAKQFLEYFKARWLDASNGL
jgi:hypothetical protein